jgi:uncharacterized protein YdaU (DUF1376 family)
MTTKTKAAYTRFFWGDWNADTMHLDLMQLGAYMKLLGYIYQHQRALPGDMDKVYRLCHATSPTEQNAIRQVLAEFFLATEDPEYGPVYRHLRAEREIEWTKNTIATNRERATIAANTRWGNAPSNAQSNASSTRQADAKQCLSNANQNQNQIQNQKEKKRGTFVPPSRDELTSYMRDTAERRELAFRPEMAQAFLDYYAANGWKVGRNPMKCWKSAASGWLARQAQFSPQTSSHPRNADEDAK